MNSTTYRRYMNHIKEETDGAMDYAEKSVLFKQSRPQFSAWYSEMAMDELKHAEYLKNIGQAMMDEDQHAEKYIKAWSKVVADLASKTATVNAMLARKAGMTNV